VGKVGKSHHSTVTYASGFTQHHFGIAQVLKRVNLEHHVKAVVFKNGQAFFEVKLKYIDPTGKTSVNFGVVDFHAIARALFVVTQISQELTITTA
jgi:hypothetical protein